LNNYPFNTWCIAEALITCHLHICGDLMYYESGTAVTSISCLYFSMGVHSYVHAILIPWCWRSQ